VFELQVLPALYIHIFLGQRRLLRQLPPQEEEVVVEKNLKAAEEVAAEEVAVLVYLADSKILRLKLIVRSYREYKHSACRM
jgi:hypothetical protein